MECADVSVGYCGSGNESNISVDVGNLTIFFSYKTVVAINHPSCGLLCSKNIWGKTSGKHINFIEPDKKKRVDNKIVIKKLEDILFYRYITLTNEYRFKEND